MIKLDFWTPVAYYNAPRTWGESFLELVDWHFYFGGRQATVIPNEYKIGNSEGIIFQHGSSRWPSTLLKIAAYFTIIVPIIAFVFKCILRLCIYKFHIIEKFSLPAKLREMSQLEWTQNKLKAAEDEIASLKLRLQKA